MTRAVAEERVLELDILRGFALFGILIVNLNYAVGSARTALDHTAQWLVKHLASEAFYSIFSFLFGAAFVLQMGRIASRSLRFESSYARRLVVLLIIGLFHMTFLWWGDIVHLYAILGFLLLLFRNRSPRALLLAALACWAFSVAEQPLLRALHVGQLQVVSEHTAERLVSDLKNAYIRGSYATVVIARMRWIPVHETGVLADGMVPNVFAFFLFGAFAARRLLPVQEHTPVIRRALMLSTVVAAAAGALRGIGLNTALVFKPALSVCYAAAVVLVVQHPTWRRRLGSLASAGRMALTNYILQSAMFTMLLYDYGFGQYRRIRPAAGIACAVTFYVLQLAASHWWLARFRQGPLEWVWRALSYPRTASSCLAGARAARRQAGGS
ncbi:MAG TPA: DUF418 domain-containing protein [Bryobacteraceae bacterium]|nr:DUF418 domain-containing protein [Bryobacteraceae bacterium]